jgi:hypothetical protein
MGKKKNPEMLQFFIKIHKGFFDRRELLRMGAAIAMIPGNWLSFTTHSREINFMNFPGLQSGVPGEREKYGL